MKWNWQKENWADFSYNASKIEVLEKQFLQHSGILKGAFKHLNNEDKNMLKIQLISDEALKTSEIEGEYLNRDSVQSSIRRHFGLNTDKCKISPAEKGIADMMFDLYDLFDNNLSHQTLFKWHKMLCAGRSDLENIGGYRTHKEPMQVISGAIHKPNIHFEAPPSDVIQKEMTEFIAWFNKTKDNLPALTRASIAHLYFVCIHPFEDGNGRIGRAIAEKALAEFLGNPTLIALSTIIEKHKKDYYDALERANKSNEITDWIIYFANTILEAQKYTQNQIDFLIAKTKFFDSFGAELNERQKKVVLRIFKAGTEGFEGGLSAENYIRITGASRATATRDLHKLLELGAFIKTGERKSTRYYSNFVDLP